MLHEAAIKTAEAEEAKTSKPDFSGKWYNQMGSTMELTVSGNDVGGEYRSASSSGGPPTCGPIKGYVTGDLISFIVLWPKGSMTAWVGQMVDEEKKPRIKTLWHLVTEIPNEKEPKFLWMSIFTGADEFTRNPAPAGGAVAA